MSTSLYYMPSCPKTHESLSGSLKYILGPLLWDHDGTLNGSATMINKGTEVMINGRSVSLYQALAGFTLATGRGDEARDGAEILMREIDKFGSVILWIEG